MLIVTNFSKAIFEVAKDKGILDKVEQDLAVMAEITLLNEFAPCLSPIIPTTTVHKIIDVMAKKYAWQPYSANFFKVCALTSRLKLIPDILTQFNKMHDYDRGIIRATITSAHDLSKNDKTNLTKIIKHHCDKGQIEINYEQDQHMVGGFVAEFTPYVIDMSLSSRLGKIKQSMLEAIET